MGPVSRFAVRKPWITILVWIVALFAIFTAVGLHKGTFDDSFSLPNTESSTAQDLLQEKFPQGNANAQTAQVLFSPATGTIQQPDVEKQILALEAKIMAIPSVVKNQDPTKGPVGVAGPYNNPQAAALGLMSPNGEVGKLQVTFTGDQETPVPAADVTTLVNEVQAVNSPSLAVGVGGSAVQYSSQGEAPSSELIGILVAIVILLIIFGSLVAAGLPLLTAIIGVATGSSLLLIAANWLSIASFGPVLASMIGLGVGIDYSLFVINRFRQAVIAGLEPKEAVYLAVKTAGRSVVFAAATVIIALAGLFILGLSFMDGVAVGAMITVVAVMITAVTLLPAVLSLLGRKALAVKMPWARHPQPHNDDEGFGKYGGGLQRHPLVYGGIAVIGMLILAVPLLSMQQGFPDASGLKPGNTQRIAYDLTTKGFGAGVNGPFIVVATVPNAAALPEAQKLATAIGQTPGVAHATAAVPSTDGSAVSIFVIPTTGPQDEATHQTLDTLRNTTIPTAVAGTGIVAYVGGQQAVLEDFSSVLASKLPIFLAIVIGLGFLVLVVLFRSLVVPAIAAVTALISFSAAMGITVAVFQWGWGASLFGITGTGPILPFLPIMLFAILFGLSMDYQVFLVSRMQEEWALTGDNKVSVRRGLGGSGRVVAAAAAIMFSVFISFVFGDDNTIKMFGLSLGTAIFLDAFVIRLIVVPCVMTIIGPANWYLPGWLGKVLPKVNVEAPADVVQEHATADGKA